MPLRIRTKPKRKKRQTGPEAAILKACTDYLATQPGAYLRQNTGKTKIGERYLKFGLKGSADITGIRNGQRIEIEVKRPDGKQSDAQKLFQAMIEKNGGRYLLVRSVDELIERL